MRIASYNINGIRARLPALLDWLDETSPDIVVLQEIKCVDEKFPCEEFETRGYEVHAHGQKSFNGVAILSKPPLEDVVRGLPGDPADAQARWVEARIAEGPPIHLCGLYLPNGNPAPGPKFDYKLRWMDRLMLRASELLASEEPALMAGDYNIIPQPEDAASAEAWTEDALFLPETRSRWRRLLFSGFYDAFRAHRPDETAYTFWDFKAGAWNRNDGIRIDHFLLTPQCADLMTDCGIDSHVRGWQRPSDHVPIWIEIED